MSVFINPMASKGRAVNLRSKVDVKTEKVATALLECGSPLRRRREKNEGSRVKLAALCGRLWLTAAMCERV